MTRLTISDLDALANELNATPWGICNGVPKRGTYYISRTECKGVALRQATDDIGGFRVILEGEHSRELFEKMKGLLSC